MLNRKTIGIILFFLSSCNQLCAMKKEITINEDQAHYFSVLPLANVGKLETMRMLTFSIPVEKPKNLVVHLRAKCTSPEKIFAFDKTGIALMKAQLNFLDIKGDFIFSFREYRDVGLYLINKHNFEDALDKHNFN